MSTYLYIYIYIYVYVYVCVLHIHIYTYIYIYIHIHTYIHMCQACRPGRAGSDPAAADPRSPQDDLDLAYKYRFILGNATVSVHSTGYVNPYMYTWVIINTLVMYIVYKTIHYYYNRLPTSLAVPAEPDVPQGVILNVYIINFMNNNNNNNS